MKSLRSGRLTAFLVLVLALITLPARAASFDVQGHRGARGLAPENTLAAFRTALNLGVDTLELDTGITRDGHMVVAHDQRLNADIARNAAGEWITAPGPAIRSLTLAELQRYDVGRLKPGSKYAAGFAEQRAVDGERIPTLDAVFELVKSQRNDTVRFNIETKLVPQEPDLALEPEAFAAALLQVIDHHGMRARVSVQSFDWRTLQAMRKLAPDVPTVALTAQRSFLDNIADGRWTSGLKLGDHGNSVPKMVKALGATTWSPYHADVSEANLAEAHALGLKVVPWTVNEPAQMDRLIAWGVDGLISDYPDRLRAALARRSPAPK